MNLFAWIVLIVLGYGALTLWVAHVMRALRLGVRPLAIALLVVPVVLLLIVPFLPAPVRIVGFEALLLGLTLILARSMAPKEALAPTRETRPAFLHLVLLSGSALFLIPFVWMVITSLKEDSQM